MGFALEPQKEILQEKAVRGRYCKVAVGCWFTTRGKTIPLWIKYEDEQGVRHRIDSIQLLKNDQKNYAGVIAQRYDCQAEVEGRMIQFTLLFHPGQNTWDMVLP